MIDNLKSTVTSAIFVILILVVISAFVLTPMLSMIILGAIFAYAIRPISSRMEPYLKFKSVDNISRYDNCYYSIDCNFNSFY